jgi:hypothetical protein
MTLDNAKKALPNRSADVLLTRFTPGQRVELAPSHWAWKPDDCRAEVTAVGRFYIHLRTDDGRELRVMPESLNPSTRKEA